LQLLELREVASGRELRIWVVGEGDVELEIDSTVVVNHDFAMLNVKFQNAPYTNNLTRYDI